MGQPWYGWILRYVTATSISVLKDNFGKHLTLSGRIFLSGATIHRLLLWHSACPITNFHFADVKLQRRGQDQLKIDVSQEDQCEGSLPKRPGPHSAAEVDLRHQSLPPRRSYHHYYWVELHMSLFGVVMEQAKETPIVASANGDIIGLVSRLWRDLQTGS